MGLRARLPDASTPQRRPATLAPQLQPATAAQLSRRSAPDQPRSQRPWVGQLATRSERPAGSQRPVPPEEGLPDHQSPSKSELETMDLEALQHLRPTSPLIPIDPRSAGPASTDR